MESIPKLEEVQTREAVHHVDADTVDLTRAVTLFGASWAKEGTDLYTLAYRVGYELGKRQYTVVNGGYSGTMEASARGCAAAQSKCVGVVVPTLFVARHQNGGGANKYNTDVIDSRDLGHRLQCLTQYSECYVVLPGTLGSLHEIISVWTEATLAKLCGKSPKKIFAFRDPWEKTLTDAATTLGFSEDTIAYVTFVDSVEDLLRHF